MKSINQFFRVSTLAVIVTLYACGNDTPIDPQQKDIQGKTDLTKAEFITTVSGSEVAVLVSSNPALQTFEPGGFEDINVYRVTYPTKNYDETELIASGLALIPQETDHPPLLSYQHGTILQQSNAPSAFDRSNTLVNLLIVFASSGYLVTAPDYIGYGASQQVPHPFEHGKTMGSSSFDMLMATRELAALLDLEPDEKLFMAGYSQGGYATMALHKHIEEHGNLEVTMSAPGAGAYNKSGTVAALKDQNILIDNPGAWLWNIHVINVTSQLNRPWNSILKAPNLSIVEGISNPMLLPTLTNLDKNPTELFTAAFIDGLSNGTDTELLDAFQENDNHDWGATDPITLYYGTEDTSVFPFHALTAFQELMDKGTPVQLVAIEGADHQGAVVPYWQGIFDLFQSLR